MSFTVDTSLTHIDAPESAVVAIFRSTAAITLPDGMFDAHPAEACICILESGTSQKASIALFDTVMKQMVVYTSDLTAQSAVEYPAVEAEAAAFVKAMGFTMEKINLKFSPAMREVIIKGLSFMKAPPRRPYMRQQQAAPAVRPVAAAPKTGSTPQGVPQENLTKEISSLKTELAATKAAAARGEGDLSTLHEENAALRQKVQLLEAVKAKLEKRIADDHSAAAEQLNRLKADNELLQSTLASERSASAAADAKIAALARFENSWREGQQREDDLCRSIDILQQQLDEAVAELEAFKSEALPDRDMSLKVASLEKELAAALKEIEYLGTGSFDADGAAVNQRALDEAKLEVETEYIRLAKESSIKEDELLEALYAAEYEIARLNTELEQMKQSVAAATESSEKVQLSQPVQQLVSETAEPVKVAGSRPAPAVREELPADDEPDTPITGYPEITGRLVNDFGTFTGSSGPVTTEFAINPVLTSIVYSQPAEIVSVLYSSNSVRAVPDGGKTETCRGYVIALKKNGGFLVYLAWHLTESQRIIICEPDSHPVDTAQCVQVLFDAVAYFEIVGFMMEVEDLGNSVSSYNRILKKNPALRRVPAA